MIGTAEDHHSNPLKIALGKFKRAGGRFIAINPVRTGYAAIADEWIPIRPGTDGALFMALMHELIARDAFDLEFVSRFTNAAELVDQRDGADTFGLFVRDAGAPEVNALYPQNRMWWDTKTNRAVLHHTEGAEPALDGRYTLDDGTPVAPSFTLLREQVAECTPEWAADITGIAADTIRRLAREMETVARDHAIALPVRWTDSWGKEHESVKGVPIAFHAMRGRRAFERLPDDPRACRADVAARHDRPAGRLPAQGAVSARGAAIGETAERPGPDQAEHAARHRPARLAGGPRGFVRPSGRHARAARQGVLVGIPARGARAMHSVITNAWRGDPYPIDTLLIFMANMAWNSSMNTTEVRKMLVDKRDDGEYRIPFLVVCDAFASEMTAFADLILPDTTYLERHDVMSVLDRPISEFDGPVDSVRVPVVPPTGECKPFQEVLIELASRLKFPAFTTADGQRKYRDYPDFVINFQTAPDSGTGFLIGWRGKDGDKAVVGEPNPDQWKRYAENNCVYHHRLPEPLQYMRNCNGPYMQWAVDNGMRKFGVPIVIQLYSDVMQKFRLAAQGRTSGRQPPDHLRERIARYFDPLPFWHRSLESGLTDAGRYPLAAITQRPMAMYHSWDSQNAWLRQIHGENHLFVNPVTAAAQQIDDGAWIYVESPWGKVRCARATARRSGPGTVWTWNAIGKAAGAWNLGPQAGESQRGFLLNHVITDELPDAARGGARMSNSDPITGQAGWYDVQVRIYPAEADAATTLPQFAPMPALPGTPRVLQRVQAYFAGTGAFAARLRRAAAAGPKSEDR